MARRLVLVVDDDAAVGVLVAAVLRREDIAVTVATDGEQALQKMAAARPDLVLTDMTMPGLSGLDLVRAAEAAGHHVPFLVMSAFLESEVERRLLEEPGVNGVLHKPFDIARLVRDVRAALERSRAAAGEKTACWALVRWQPALAFWRPALRRPAAPGPRRAPGAGGEREAGAGAC